MPSESAGVVSKGNGAALDCSPVVLAREQPFRIGTAAFRPATREVIFGGESCIIEPRVMQLLVALYRADGHIVSKIDLTDLCWGGRIVGDDAIHRVVSRLRTVAEKQAGGQFEVETVPKVGYRLVDQHNRSKHQTLGDGFRIGRREMLVGGCALTLGAVGIGWVNFKSNRTSHEAQLLIDSARKSLRAGDFGDSGNAIGTLRRATEAAPKSAEAWGLLAFAFAVGAYDAPVQSRPDFQARSLAAMRRAFALEPNQADALAAKIHTNPLYRNWFAFEQACRSALLLHPDHPELLVELGMVLAEVGRVRESLQIFDRAMPLMPLSAELLTSRAFLLSSLGQLDAADAAIESAFDLMPNNLTVWNAKAFFLMYGGRPREAAEMFGNKDARPPSVPQWDYELQTMEANAIAAGGSTERHKAVKRLVGIAEEGHGFVMTGAIFAGYVGELDAAFRLLNALYFNRGFRLPDAYLNRANLNWGGERHTRFLFSRQMALVRHDARFARLTRDLGLDDYWSRTNSRSQIIL